MQLPVGEATAQGRELRTLAIVSAAHFVSHYHILVLVALLPFLRTALDVDYVALGVALTIFNVVSGFSQAPMGFVADRVGPRRLLVAGLCLGGLAFASLAVFTSYSWLLVAAALAGLANSVYHPADYAILTSSMSQARIGKAFSIHTFSGFLGGAVAPTTLFAIATQLGLWAAFLAAGILAWAVALALCWPAAVPAKQSVSVGRRPTDGSPLDILTPAVLGMTVFFALISLSTGPLQSFSVVAFVSAYGVSLTTANLALTAFLAGTAIGVLAGGILADRTRRHGEVAAMAYALAGVVVVLIATLNLGGLGLIVLMGAAGFLTGIIAPSRDMIVRAAAPPGAEGRVFGIVSTGFNIGGAIGPIIFGWIMDRGEPRWMFGASVLFILLAIILILVERPRPRPVVRQPDAAE
jgi:MFS transporter, FSR family, fosmidomycin resistance protein